MRSKLHTEADFWLVFCLLLAICLSCIDSCAPHRIVRFPWTGSVGVLYVRELGSSNERAWKKLGKARGYVFVPSGKELKFVIDYRKRSCRIDLSPLSKLDPHDLQAIDLSWSCVSDEQLAHIEGFTLLKSLNLEGTGISDAGLAHVENLASLENLDLSATRISAGGIAYISALENLRSLDLSFTSIDNKVVQYLKAQHSLRTLKLHGTRVNEAGLEELEKALPDCTVIPSNAERKRGVTN